MRRELSKAEVERLFSGAADDALGAVDQTRLGDVLEQDTELKGEFERYQRAVKALRGAPKEKAPDALASLVMRRVRRRRSISKRMQWTADYRVPVEVIVPLLLAVLVALFVVLGP